MPQHHQQWLQCTYVKAHCMLHCIYILVHSDKCPCILAWTAAAIGNCTAEVTGDSLLIPQLHQPLDSISWYYCVLLSYIAPEHSASTLLARGSITAVMTVTIESCMQGRWLQQCSHNCCMETVKGEHTSVSTSCTRAAWEQPCLPLTNSLELPCLFSTLTRTKVNLPSTSIRTGSRACPSHAVPCCAAPSHLKSKHKYKDWCKVTSDVIMHHVSAHNNSSQHVSFQDLLEGLRVLGTQISNVNEQYDFEVVQTGQHGLMSNLHDHQVQVTGKQPKLLH